MSTRAKKRPRPAKRKLSAYRAKRDLARSGEPGDIGGVPAAEQPRFVVQQHAASRLHFDFRLEMEGVLRSWAVPKGVPTRAGDKSLAIEVEDHPLAYGNFEGTIPAGHYGAGTVQVWDAGFYQTLDGDPLRAYRAGHLHLVLAGRKCRGEWTLVRIRRPRDGDRKQWLLIKVRSKQRWPQAKAGETAARARSVLTGRTMAEIAAGGDEGGDGDEPDRAAPPARKPAAATGGFVEPMKAKAVTAVPGGTAWRLELKFDGYRALAAVGKEGVRLWSRNGHAWEEDFREVAAAVARQCRPGTLLDGEIVALDAEGRSRFQLLQRRQATGEEVPLCYYVFDLLKHEGRSLVREPIERRRELLERVLARARDPLRLSPVFLVPPEQLMAEVRRRGLEGIIAKAPGSLYEIGRRSGAWLKCRLAREQEFVIGGFTAPQGARMHFGAILVGYYAHGKLRYAGKVGTGFEAASLEQLHDALARLVAPGCPFAESPGIAGARWVRPRLVAQIRFSEWTGDGRLRHPVFVGMRTDKAAREVHREALATAAPKRIKAAASA